MKKEMIYFILLWIALIVVFFLNGITYLGHILADIFAVLFQVPYQELIHYDLLHYPLTLLSLILLIIIYGKHMPFWKKILHKERTAHVFFSPAYLFSLFALLFFLITFLPIRLAHTGKDFIPSAPLIFIFFIGILLFLIGSFISSYYFVDKKREYLAAKVYLRFPRLSFILPLFVWIATISLGVYYFIKVGIPIFSKQIRGWRIGYITNGILDLQIILIYLLPRLRRHFLIFLLPFLSILFFTLKGIRYQILIISLAFVIYWGLSSKLNLKKIGIVLLIVGIVGFSVIGLLKHNYISSQYEDQFDGTISALSFQTYSSSVSTWKNMERLLNEIPPFGIFKGKLIWNTIYTVLPGTQEAASTTLSKIVIEGYTGYEASSSLHFSSLAYMLSDLGKISLVIYSFIFGYYLTFMYNLALSRNTECNKEIYLPTYCILIAMFISGLPTTVFRSYWIIAYLASLLLLIPWKSK